MMDANILYELRSVKEIKSENSNIVFHEKRATDRMGYFLDVSKFTTYSSWTPAISVETGARKRVRPKSIFPVKPPKIPRSQMKYRNGGGTSSRKKDSNSATSA